MPSEALLNYDYIPFLKFHENGETERLNENSLAAIASTDYREEAVIKNIADKHLKRILIYFERNNKSYDNLTE